MFSRSASWGNRLFAAGVHLSLSLLVASLAALLVFAVWYPYPYREISGGRSLFLLVVTVDVIMGPLLTLAVFNRSKPLKDLRLDLAVIGLLQLVALAYGLWTVAVARPVHLVFEFDRFRVVHAIEIPPELLERAPAELRHLPLMGRPSLLSVREFKNAQESFEATMAAVQGVALGARPDLWQSYEQAKAQIKARARPVGELKSRFPGRAAEIDRALGSASSSVRAATSVGYIPLASRRTFWTVLLDTNTTEVLAFVPIDSF